MIMIPAIDLKDGKVVRLAQGEFDQVTSYDKDPLAVAQKWAALGAECIHVVDLDGAQSGSPVHTDLICRLAADLPVPIEVGGGIRTFDDIDRLVAGGVSRIILGTKAATERRFVKSVVQLWPGRVAVALDCKEGQVMQKGWVDGAGVSGLDLARQVAADGVECLIYTDIARDGMLTGPNIPGLKAVLDSVEVDVIASGGISHIDDISHLVALRHPRLIGAITGKAIYEGTLDLTEAIALCSQKE